MPRSCLSLIFAWLFVLPLQTRAATFDWSGYLTDSGKPANGTYTLRAQWYGSVGGADALGEPITLYAVQVRDGRFSVPVDLPPGRTSSQPLWIAAQVQPPGTGEFIPLAGRQPLQSTVGGTCWETAGNSAANGSIVGHVFNPANPLLALVNDGSRLYLRRTGGVEQGNSTASGKDSAAWGGESEASALNSFAVGRGTVQSAHGYSIAFGDSSAIAPFSSTAPNQFLVRATGGFGINANTPLGSLHVRRGSGAGITTVSTSSIVAESDGNHYVSVMSPATHERGILFGDAANSAKGGIIFNPVGAGITNPDGLTFRTGGNRDVLRLTSGGIMTLNEQNNGPYDVVLRTAVPNTGFQMNLRSFSGNSGTLSVANGLDTHFQVQALSGDLVLIAPGGGSYVRTSTRLGVGRSAISNQLEVEGNASKSTAGAWLAHSDRRIKRDIQPVTDALALLRQIEPVTFRYDDAYRRAHPEIADQRYYNVIAQDYAKVFPEAVQRSAEVLPGHAHGVDNQILQVDTHPAAITAIAAIQELDAANSLQDRELAQLKQENHELRERLERLERLLSTTRR